MNKRGIIKIGAGIFLLLLLLILIFSLFFSSASTGDSYALGEEVKIDLSNYEMCSLKIKTPSTTIVQDNCEEKLSLKFEEVGEYIINIKSEYSSERLEFQVYSNRENYILFDFKNDNTYILWNTLKFDFNNLGNYELVIISPSGKRVSRVSSNDIFFFNLVEEGTYSVSFERGNRKTLYEFYVIQKESGDKPLPGDLIQGKAEINEPVGWSKILNSTENNNGKNNLIEIPGVINLTLKKENGEIFTNYTLTNIEGKNYIQFNQNLSEDILQSPQN
jgi:uncharacterized protein YkuJ